MQNEFYNLLRNIKIDKDFSEWFAIWLGDGDRSTKRGTFGISNQCKEMLIFNIKILTRVFKFESSRLRCEIVTNESNLQKVKEKWSNILAIPLNQIRYVQRNENARKDCARVFVYSNLALKALLSLEDIFLTKISKSNKEIKSAFINGIFASEGNVRTDSKCVRIGMKARKIPAFTKRILVELGIESHLSFNVYTKSFELCIFSYDNLVKFKELNAFGKHFDKNLELDKQLKSYESKLPWIERFRRLGIPFRNKKFTSLDLVRITNIKKANAGYFLREFVKQGKLSVDKSNKNFIYSLN